MLLPTSRKSLLRWLALGTLVLGYIGAWGYAGYRYQHTSDLDFFFFIPAQEAYFGHPLSLYSLRLGIYPNASGPLSFIPLTLAVALLSYFGWLGIDHLALRHLIIMMTFAPFPLLLALEADCTLRRLRPNMNLPSHIAFTGSVIVSPLLYIGILQYGHIELVLSLWLTLWGIRRFDQGHMMSAGLLSGLALLARSTALIYILCCVLILVQRCNLSHFLRYFGIVCLVAGLGIAPFFFTSPADVIFSLVSYRAALPIRGGAFWTLTLNTPLEHFAQHWDMVFVIGAIITLTLLLLYKYPLMMTGRRLYGLLAVVAIIFPLFAKTTWPYYILDPYVFVLIWVASAMKWSKTNDWLRLSLPLLLVTCALILLHTFSDNVQLTIMLIEGAGITIILSIQVLFLIESLNKQ